MDLRRRLAPLCLAPLYLAPACATHAPTPTPATDTTPAKPTEPPPVAPAAPAFDLKPGAAAWVPTPLPPELATSAVDARLLVFTSPDDAAGAAEGAVLQEVAVVQGKAYLAWSTTLPMSEDEVVVRGGTAWVSTSRDDEMKVYRVAGHQLEALPMPPAKVWKVKPTRPELVPVSMSELIVGGTEGAPEVWLARCTGGGPEDGGWCEDWVFAQLVPTVAPSAKSVLRARPTLMTPPPAANVSLPAPAGYVLTPAKRAPMGEAEPGNPPTERMGLHCQGPAGAESDWPPEVGDAFFNWAEATWVSTEPPLYMIGWDFWGLDLARAHALMAACVATPVAENAWQWQTGPRGLWTIQTDEVPWSLYQAGTLVARFDHATKVVFLEAP